MSFNASPSSPSARAAWLNPKISDPSAFVYPSEFEIYFDDGVKRDDMKWEGFYKMTTRHTIYDKGEGTVMAEMDGGE